MSTVEVDAGSGGVQPEVELRVTLRRLRRQRGLSQRDLLEPLHIASHSTIVDYESGRRVPPADVLAGYERMFGLPTGSLVTLRDRTIAERARLDAQSALATSGTTVTRRTDEARPALPAPRQLPAAVTHFTGRGAELATLDQMLDGDPAPVIISAICGAGGVGKTALAVHWGHLTRDRFTDGELYVDLRGYHPHDPPLAARTVLGQFLHALGLSGQQIPESTPERAALYRSMLAQRRMLVILDNARDVDHVRPLLPGVASCVAVVTSRDRMAGLVAREVAQRILLDGLTPRDAVQLLRRAVGVGRVDAEPGASSALSERCGYHPLALRVAAEQIAAYPRASIAELLSVLVDRPAGPTS